MKLYVKENTKFTNVYTDFTNRIYKSISVERLVKLHDISSDRAFLYSSLQYGLLFDKYRSLKK